ncbi:RNA polymerase sigma-70 factor [Pedobacter sp.]|jgi:RNA polymerase sigma-70 factor (family 1)|uniref:RNA polymerase sigma factor n=1 Tax=Pedobacter sp. TaxID=1411316 RepID=UPI002BEA77CA|nr:RNA polymerase sigma-70 factor [Pedobacter sp.]HWW42913.1 RNA polymerase sigma-70 factor [Pedobacter sp.]
MGNHSTAGSAEHHTPVYDLKTFEDLYRRMYPTLIKYAVYLVKDAEEAQLLLNDVFISIWKNKVQITEEKAYLFRSVKNAALTYLKNSKVQFRILEEEQIPLIPDQNADPSQAYQEKDRNRALYNLIDQLPERRRLVFYLYRIDGFSYKEIATLLDISVRTVEDHLVKGFQFLQEKVTRHEEEFR